MQVGFSKKWSPTSVIPGSIGLILPWPDLFSLDLVAHSSINQMDLGFVDPVLLVLLVLTVCGTRYSSSSR